MNKTNHLYLAVLIFLFMDSFFLYSNEDSLELEEINIYKVTREMGKSNINYPILNKINKTDIPFFNYTKSSDLFIYLTPYTTLSTGNIGKLDKISAYGGILTNINFNNIPLFGNGFQQFNLLQLSPESFENIEILEGTEAIAMSLNPTNLLINHQEINYDTKTPHVRLWASDMGDNIISFDGVFAQNIAPNLNFYLGYNSYSGDYNLENDEIRSRNLRIALKKNFSDFSSLRLSYYHSNHFLESNGGINQFLSIDANGQYTDDEINSFFKFDGLNRREKNHLFSLNYFNSYDSTNNFVIQSNILTKFSNIDEQISDNFIKDTLTNNYYRFSNFEITSNNSFEYKFNNFLIKPLINLFYQNTEKSFFINENEFLNYNFATFLKYSFVNFNLLSSINYSNFLDKNLINFGVALEIKLDENYVKFDINHIERASNLYFQYDNIESENNFFINYRSNFFNTSSILQMYYKNISNIYLVEEIYENNKVTDYKTTQKNLDLIGLTFFTKFKMFQHIFFDDDQIIFQNKLITNPLVLSGDSYLPIISNDIIAYFSVPRGRSVANLGIEYSLIINRKGYFYNEFFDVYGINDDYKISNNLDRINLFLSLKLNHAYLKLSMNNVLNSTIYNFAYHKFPQHLFRLSFNWTIR